MFKLNCYFHQKSHSTHVPNARVYTKQLAHNLFIFLMLKKHQLFCIIIIQVGTSKHQYGQGITKAK